MHPLCDAAIEVTEKLREERLRVARLSLEMSEAEYGLQVIRARVERGLIRQVGGEKRLAPTVEDRARISTVALDANQEYGERLKQRNEIERQLGRFDRPL